MSSASKGTAAGYMVFVEAGGDVDSVYGKTSGKIVLYQICIKSPGFGSLPR